MTRLTEKDIKDLSGSLHEFEKSLKQITGSSLAALACRAAGVSEEGFRSAAGKTSLAAIPFATGEGIIQGFSEILAALAVHLGFRAGFAAAPGVEGLAEAAAAKAKFIITADDNRFIALNLANLYLADNNSCTAAGFVAALDLMCSGLSGKNVLILGCGPVGGCACERIVAAGASPFLYDPNRQKSRLLSDRLNRNYNIRANVEENLEEALAKHELILDASPARNLIRAHHISDSTFISAPGVPEGLSPGARNKLGDRYLHDPLLIGAAVMMVSASCP